MRKERGRKKRKEKKRKKKNKWKGKEAYLAVKAEKNVVRPPDLRAGKWPNASLNIVDLGGFEGARAPGLVH